MAFQSDEDKKVVRDMIIAGRNMKEIMDLGVCQQADVYNMRHILKSEGVSAKKPKPIADSETPETVKKVAKETKKETPPWLEALIAEQERLHEVIRRIDALVAMYDDLIPLPKILKSR